MFHKPILLAVMLALAPLSASAKTIKKLEDFQALVVGKTLQSDDGSVKILANGKVTGKLQGKRVKGNWNWQGRYFCRALVWGGQAMGSDCQTVKVNGSTLHLKRQKGKGRVTSYTIK